MKHATHQTTNTTPTAYDSPAADPVDSPGRFGGHFGGIEVHQASAPYTKANRGSDILGRFGLTRVINATGTVTRLGASPLDAEVIDAMAAGARSSVDIAAHQGPACGTIAQDTAA